MRRSLPRSRRALQAALSPAGGAWRRADVRTAPGHPWWVPPAGRRGRAVKGCDRRAVRTRGERALQEVTVNRHSRPLRRRRGRTAVDGRRRDRSASHTLSLLIERDFESTPGATTEKTAGAGVMSARSANGDRLVDSREITIASDPVTGQFVFGVGAAAARRSGFNTRRRWGRKTMARRRGSGPQRIVAPMPGKVVRVLGRPGDSVRASSAGRRHRSHEDGKRAPRHRETARSPTCSCRKDSRSRPACCSPSSRPRKHVALLSRFRSLGFFRYVGIGLASTVAILAMAIFVIPAHRPWSVDPRALAEREGSTSAQASHPHRRTLDPRRARALRGGRLLHRWTQAGQIGRSSLAKKLSISLDWAQGVPAAARVHHHLGRDDRLADARREVARSEDNFLRIRRNNSGQPPGPRGSRRH